MRRISLTRNLATAALALLASACAQQIGPGDGGAPDVATRDVPLGADAGSDVADAPDRSDAAPDAPDAPDPPAEGYIEAVSFRDPIDGTVKSSADGHFFRTPPGFSCSEVLLGPCTLRRCTQPASDGGVPPATQWLSVGMLTIDDGTPAGPIVVPRDSVGETYDTGLIPGARWSSGVTLSFVAIGGDLPPFSVSLPFPAQADLVAPAFAYDDRSVVIDRTHDLVLSWTTFETGTLVFRLSTDDGATLRCEFDSPPGSATIPAATLAQVPATSPDGAVLDISSAFETEQHIGALTLHVRTAFELLSSSAEVP